MATTFSRTAAQNNITIENIFFHYFWDSIKEMKTFIYFFFLITIILHICLFHSKDSIFKIHFSARTENTCNYIDTNKINPYQFSSLFSFRSLSNKPITFDGKSYIFYSENLSLVNFEIEEIIYQNSDLILKSCLLDYKIHIIEKVPSIITGIIIYIFFITFFILSSYKNVNFFFKKNNFFPPHSSKE